MIDNILQDANSPAEDVSCWITKLKEPRWENEHLQLYLIVLWQQGQLGYLPIPLGFEGHLPVASIQAASSEEGA